MGQRSVRFPDELEARAVARAEELDRPFSWVAVKALDAWLSRPVIPADVDDRIAAATAESPAALERLREQLMEAPGNNPAAAVAAIRGEGECPVARCSLRGPLGEKCPNHPNMRFKAT